MTDTDTITLPRAQYEALLAEKETLEDQIAALDGDVSTTEKIQMTKVSPVTQ